MHYISWISLSLTFVCTGCYTASRLQDIGDVPPLTRTQDPTAYTGYQPVKMPMPVAPSLTAFSPNSLWRPGAHTFFKDQRATRVGDVLTVTVNFNDSAVTKNKTKYTKAGNQLTQLRNILGFESKLGVLLPKAFDPRHALDTQNGSDYTGDGNIDRQEKISVNIAASVIQLLPNGNLIISGRQETRINFEVREVLITGIIRPEDITAQNTIPYDKIAEARLSYGGRGQMTDVQQPPYGQQFLQQIMPF